MAPRTGAMAPRDGARQGPRARGAWGSARRVATRCPRAAGAGWGRRPFSAGARHRRDGAGAGAGRVRGAAACARQAPARQWLVHAVWPGCMLRRRSEVCPRPPVPTGAAARQRAAGQLRGGCAGAPRAAGALAWAAWAVHGRPASCRGPDAGLPCSDRGGVPAGAPSPRAGAPLVKGTCPAQQACWLRLRPPGGALACGLCRAVDCAVARLCPCWRRARRGVGRVKGCPPPAAPRRHLGIRSWDVADWGAPTPPGAQGVGQGRRGRARDGVCEASAPRVGLLAPGARHAPFAPPQEPPAACASPEKECQPPAARTACPLQHPTPTAAVSRGRSLFRPPASAEPRLGAHRLAHDTQSHVSVLFGLPRRSRPPDGARPGKNQVRLPAAGLLPSISTPICMPGESGSLPGG